MRWLYHIVPAGTDPGARYSPASLDAEGFVHCSFRDAVRESARLYFRQGDALDVLRIDPRRVGARVEIAETPRGPMPHVHGAIPRDAVAEVLPLDAPGAIEGAPDRVTGTHVGFVAFDGMTLLDLVGVLDPVGRIASMGFDPTARTTVVSAAAPRVWTCEGASLTVDRVRPPLDAFDVLVVPGGHGTRSLLHDRGLADWLASFPENRLMASVCTGALLLGAAGRLRGLRATTHRSMLADLAGHGAVPVDLRLVDEGQVVTAGGVTCALELGIHIVHHLEGDEAARRIAAQMDLPRPAFTLRLIRAEDDAAMAAVIRAVMPEFGAKGPGFAINDPEVDWMSRAYAGPRAAYFVVERRGKVMGGGGLGPLAGASDEVCELRKMYLLPEARGGGAGRDLLARCIETARAMGYRTMYLETLTGMDAAQHLYARFGFERLAAPMGATGHHGCNRFYALALDTR